MTLETHTYQYESARKRTYSLCETSEKRFKELRAEADVVFCEYCEDTYVSQTDEVFCYRCRGYKHDKNGDHKD